MASDNLTQFKQILVSNHAHVTKARVATFKFLNSQEPQTIAQILTRAKGRVDRVSIYRNIDLFERLGIVHRLYVGWKYKLELSEQFIAHHHHLSCLSCGKVIDIGDERHIDDFIADIASQYGFIPKRHQFEVDGTCKDCLAKQQPV